MFEQDVSVNVVIHWPLSNFPARKGRLTKLQSTWKLGEILENPGGNLVFEKGTLLVLLLSSGDVNVCSSFYNETRFIDYFLNVALNDLYLEI